MSAPPSARGGAPEVVSVDDGESPLEWSVNPWRRNPTQAVLALIISAALGAVILTAGLQALVGIVLAIAVTLSLAPAWAPVRCRVDAVGVGRGLAGVWTRRRWSDIRRVQLEAGRRAPDLFVSPQDTPGPLDAFRGLHLPLPREGGERARLVVGLHLRIRAHGFER